MPQKTTLSPFHQDFIRKNYQRLADSEMAGLLKIRAYHILLFRIKNGLHKKAPNELRRFEMKGKYFKVEAVDNWLV